MANIASRKTFFSLPQELRDIIYGFVLVEEEPITVSTSGYAREGLVSASRRLRNETLDTFYFENTFVALAPSFRLDAYSRLTQSLDTLRFQYKNRDKRIRITVQSDLRPHWNNLVAWLRLYHRSGAPSWTSPETLPGLEDPNAERFLVRWIPLVFESVGNRRGHPWVTVEEEDVRRRWGGSRGYPAAVA